MLRGFHLEVARILADSAASEGFALGGGYGLQAHGIIDRPSKDLDAYAASHDPEVFHRAEQKLVAALLAEGLEAEVEETDSWFRGIAVSNPATGEQIKVDLGYDYRSSPPVIVEGIGRVLDVEDVVLGKVRAFVDRGFERDFVDVDAILQDGRWSPDDLYEKIQSIRPEVERDDFNTHLRHAHLGDPEEYAALGLSLEDLSGLFSRLESASNGGTVYVSAHTRNGHHVRAHWRSGPA